jgi:hypothetical protein
MLEHGTYRHKVLDIGNVAEGAVIELLAEPDESIKICLITVEIDKDSTEVPSSQGCVVKEFKVKKLSVNYSESRWGAIGRSALLRCLVIAGLWPARRA